MRNEANSGFLAENAKKRQERKGGILGCGLTLLWAETLVPGDWEGNSLRAAGLTGSLTPRGIAHRIFRRAFRPPNGLEQTLPRP